MFHHVRDALCVVMGSQAHTMTLMAASVGSALLYGITSTSMAFLNKIVLDVYGFNYPLTIMSIQMMVTFIIMRSLDYFQYIKLTPLTRENLRQFSAPCFFYSLNGVLSLAALGSMNLTMYSVVKRNGPLVTMILATIVLKKGWPARNVIIGVLMMSVGCIIAANGDITFDLEAYSFGAGSVISQSLYLILLQKLSDNFSTSDTLYMNSVLSFPALVTCAGIFGEYQKAYYFDRHKEIGFIVSLTVLLFMGSFLNFTLFLCNSNNSALTTSVVGTLKSVAQTTMGMFTFGGVSFNPALLTGVTMNLTGGIFYTYAKYRESQRIKEMKKVMSSPSVSDVERGDQNHNINKRSAAGAADNHTTTTTHLHVHHPVNDKSEQERIL